MAADDPALLTLESDQMTVAVSPRGAELQWVRSDDGAQWLWHGDPAYWSWRSPLLFPVVGRSPDDHVTVAGDSRRQRLRHPSLPTGFERWPGRQSHPFAPLR